MAAAISADRISRIVGLSTVAPPEGAMYVLVRVDLQVLGAAPRIPFSQKNSSPKSLCWFYLGAVSMRLDLSEL